MSAPEIGVLVPVRLETRFVAPARQRPWRLRVRVVPDAFSITNHHELASVMELDAVETMWRAAGGPDLESAVGRRAWRALAAAVGPERAAWLARTFPAVVAPDGSIGITRPTETRTEMRAPRVMGLPPTMEIWIARGGRPAALAATLSVLADAVDLDLDDPDSARQPWWVSFTEAARVGVAAEIDLGPAPPTDLDAVYVVGIGGGDPGPLLTAHADGGRLGVVAPGAPTSSVDGAPAVATGDTDAWRRLVTVGANAQAGTRVLSTALTGAPVVRGVVGGDADPAPVNRALVGALWPALWGHSLANVWGEVAQADALGLWAADNLVPEGPLPSLRVGDQPYGVLPATSLRRWRAATGDPAVEARLVPLVRQLVDRWSAAAERQAAAPGEDDLHRLVRNPNATRYEWRWMMPTPVAEALAFRFDQPVAGGELRTWWGRQARQTPRLDPAVAPDRQLVAVGWQQDVGLPLVAARELPDGDASVRALARLASAPVSELLAAGPADDAVSGAPRAAPAWGRSVLTELARYSLVASAAAVARRSAGQPRALVEPPSVDRRVPTETETWATRLRPTDLLARDDPAVRVRRNVVDGLSVLAGEAADDVERALRAALDTATSRLDPWATGVAWRRLQSLAAAPRSLGVYGWVDAPRPRASDGDHRSVLAPSTEQAAVAAVLRDRALRDPDADRWQLDLTSDAVRGARRLATETREGSHPAEVLGRLVEEVVGRPDVVDRLRAAYPSTPSIPTVPGFVRPELRVRRPCDGIAVLDAAEHAPADLGQLGVSGPQIAALTDLGAAVDALADLHVAESVLGVVRSRTATVAAATAAAAGTGLPPDFDVVRTPRGGRVVNTVVLAVLPDVAAPAGPHPSPAAVADAAVAAELDVRSGDPAGPTWTWTTMDEAGRPLSTVTLADAGLRPCDTVGLGIGNVRDAVRDATGARLDSGNPAGHAVVRSFAAALAGVPALAEDVGDAVEDGGAVAAELSQRYASVRDAAIADAADARLAATPGAAEDAQRAALAQMARWGITPLATDVPDPTVGTLADRVRRAAEALERRVGDAPATLDGATTSAPALAQAIGALVAPEGPFPVFGRLRASAFDGLVGEPATGAGTGGARLDPEWLETVAAVRPALARLEAVQLAERIAGAGHAPLRAWSNRPGDPWQTAASPPSDVEVVRPSRLVAAFGPASALPDQPTAATAGTVAASVIDRFAETVPDTEHVAALAFPHDAPTARAPQAVLLAVPPVVDEELSPAVLVDVISEVRALARARMVEPAGLGADATGSLHYAALPASGRTGVDLGAR